MQPLAGIRILDFGTLLPGPPATPLFAEKSFDAIVEQIRRSVIDRLGRIYEAVSVMNPCIIHRAIIGYGQSGPRVSVAARDIMDAFSLPAR